MTNAYPSIKADLAYANEIAARMASYSDEDIGASPVLQLLRRALEAEIDNVLRVGKKAARLVAKVDSGHPISASDKAVLQTLRAAGQRYRSFCSAFLRELDAEQKERRATRNEKLKKPKPKKPKPKKPKKPARSRKRT